MTTSVISVRVTPRSSRDEIGGWQDGALRVRLRAPPVEGRANDGICRLLAARLGLPPTAITVERGASSRTKAVRIEGLDLDEVRARLAVS